MCCAVASHLPITISTQFNVLCAEVEFFFCMCTDCKADVISGDESQGKLDLYSSHILFVTKANTRR